MEYECPLCHNSKALQILAGPDRRGYHHCVNCSLIFANPEHRFPPEKEKLRYEQHDNGIHNPGYVDYLNQIIVPALEYINSEMTGLDFGCGPAPTLHLMLDQRSIHCDVYDPYFFPDLQTKTYDFIFATESFEHFNTPANDISRISELLKKDAFLFVMTQKWTTPELFRVWSYARDATHVSFFHDKTFDFISEKYGFELIENAHPRIVILKKK
ncbi:MAG: class I SAM-dependent methyltransferase [Bacteroidetes bacterium HGW-Bacteroidetes-11]|jgi:SAM-dependent methyltransferase|nr:MAG: class I SAM-dependent methyltransferase [Bacteroidetes bacterium HGW-Bacteroidetes-11]